jgi:RHS repeat-associated protein
VAVKDASGTTLKTYEYDGLHRRVSETAGGTTTDFYYSDAWQVLEERVTSHGRQSVGAQYVWSPVYVDALVLRDRDSNGDGTLDERLYVAQDANYNVTALFDNSGNVVERYLYDPFGQVTILDANWNVLTASAFGWAHLHQGGRFDATSGLYHFRHRDYSSTLGRWTSLDPLRYTVGDVNLYRALGNSLVNTLDPSGLEDYRSKFWNGFSDSAKKAEQFTALRATSDVHHTKPQILRELYEHWGINIDDPEYLRGVQRGKVHQAFTDQQRAWIQSEMDMHGKGWQYGNKDHMRQFINKVKNDKDFFARLNKFTDMQTQLGEEAGILFKNNLTARQVNSQFKRLDGAARQARAVLSVKSFSPKLLPRAGTAMAVFSVLVVPEVAFAGHSPEQEMAFQRLMNRYDSVYATAAKGGRVDQLQLQLLQGDFITYLRTLGLGDAEIAIIERQIAIYLSNK